MKNILSLFTFTLFILTSCTSDEPGPRGPQGPPGEPGADGLIGTVFEVEGDFTNENDFSLLAEFEDFTSVEVFESDIVQVYLRVGEDGTANGEPVYLWRALPQTYYIEEGTVTYNYDFTYFDVNIFLDSNVDLESLNSDFTDNQVFRIAILPADFATTKDVNINNYNEVMSALQVKKENIPVLEIQ